MEPEIYIRIAMGLPYTPSHPDDDYRILRLQAAIPTDSGGGGVIVQSAELCFHAGFHLDRETALSLHISEGRVTVSRPRALEGEPPPNGLIINCGRVDLFNEDRLDDLVLPLSPLPPEIRCFSRISTGNRIACAIAAMTIIAFAFFSFQWQPTAPAPMVPFLPLQYLLNSTVRIPLISFNLFFNIDEKLHRDPRIPVPITPQPPMMITNTETTTLVKNLTKTIINIFDDRLAALPSAHHLDEHALVCGQSQHSLTMLAELVEVYKLKAQSFWGSTSLDIGLGLHLDLEERLFALAGALDAILVGELDAGVFSYGSLKHAPPYYGDMPGPAAQNLVESYREYFTWLSRYVDMLQWCPMVDYLAPDFPLRPFRPLRETSHAEHDDFLVSLQRNLSSWVLETELKRLRYSRVDDISWQQPHPLLQLAYYVTGLHALTSHIHSIARSVMGCQAAWPQASEPRLWVSLFSTASQANRYHRHKAHDPTTLPSHINKLSTLISGPLNAEVIRVLTAVVALTKESQQLKDVLRELDMLRTRRDWRDARKGGRFPLPKKQAGIIREVRSVLGMNVDELFRGYTWWHERETKV